jgi:restriction endonuclease S subunit
MKFMTPEEAKNFGKCRLKEDDLIIVRSGVNTGDCARIAKEFSTAYAAYDLILDLKSSVNPEYMNVFLNLDFGKSQIHRVKARSAQPHLNANEVKSLKIPLPPREIQDKIASIMDEAHRTKKKRDSEAERLLNSIEAYTLELLRIKIPEVEEKSPKVFSVAAEILKDERLDPFYYEPRYKAIDGALRKGKYGLIEFGKIISEISGGATPKAKGRAYVEQGGIPFLRVQNITEEGIKLEDVKYINEITHNGYLKRSKLKPKDLIFTITGRIGTVAVVPEDFGEGNINQHSVRIHLIEGVNEKYIASFFNTPFGRSLSLRGVSGGTRIALDYEAIKSIVIPLPSLSIQERIVNEIQKRREKAKRLKEEAGEFLERAKQKIEKMVLGEIN